ncbi:MAG: hypothetical protein JWO53_1282 [Chlamydiia bacterium]|nr:hypothetical protein [Chlamydiia bacterium]
MATKTITVSSFKGGTAKTSTSLHVGAALAKFHKQKVLLIDFDAQANLTLGLGFDPDSIDSMAPVLQGTKILKDVVQKTCVKGLDIVPADTWLERVEVTGTLAADRYSHEKLKISLENSGYDIIIIDTPPSLCWLTESALIASTEAIVCATPEFYSIKGLERLSQFMSTIAERHPMQILGVVLSFWNARGKSNDSFLNVIERAFPGKCFDAKIRKDIQISEASIYGKPLFELAKIKKESRAAEDYQLLAKEILTRLKS